MSLYRTSRAAGYVNPKKRPHGPNGRGLCRQCGEEVPVGRRTFCNDQCVSDWQVKTSPGHVRNLLFKRDHGICCICGLDTVACYKQHLRNRPERASVEAYRAWLLLDKKYGFNLDRRHGWYWDADHVVAVCQNGGECSLDGFRTLCIPCHRHVTAELRRSLALAKNSKKK